LKTICWHGAAHIVRHKHEFLAGNNEKSLLIKFQCDRDGDHCSFMVIAKLCVHSLDLNPTPQEKSAHDPGQVRLGAGRAAQRLPPT
jgi:hypothetical protein